MIAIPLLLAACRARLKPRGTCSAARRSRSRKSAVSMVLATRRRVAATIWSRLADIANLVDYTGSSVEPCGAHEPEDGSAVWMNASLIAFRASLIGEESASGG